MIRLKAMNGRSADTKICEYELVIFDCDGVLVDSEPLSNSIFKESLSEHGLQLTDEEAVSAFTGLSLPMAIEAAEEMLGRRLPLWFADAYEERIIAALSEEVEMIAGVEEVLTSIKGKKCVASNGRHAKIRATLTKTGLLKYFRDCIFSAEDVERGKPHPDLFQYAARQMNVRPESCVVIEDSVLGVRGARAAGMHVLAFTESEAAATKMANEQVETFAAMSDLRALLGSLSP